MTNGSRDKIKQLDNDYIRQVATNEHGQASESHRCDGDGLF